MNRILLILLCLLCACDSGKVYKITKFEVSGIVKEKNIEKNLAGISVAIKTVHGVGLLGSYSVEAFTFTDEKGAFNLRYETYYPEEVAFVSINESPWNEIYTTYTLHKSYNESRKTFEIISQPVIYLIRL